MLDEKTVKKYFEKKKYLHFDKRIDFKKVKNYVCNSENIKTHSFLPFIYYVDETVKFTGEPCSTLEGRPIERKPRDIMYAGHLDNYIYKYYTLKLYESYNNWMKENDIDACSTAYRDNKKNKSNIDFSAEVISEIVSFKNAYILVGDFTKFFDKIDHRILKRNLIRILGGIELSRDWYNIFRSVTKYGYYEKDEINDILGSDNQLRRKGQFSYFKSVNHFRKFQRRKITKYNKKKYGIPQGTALSGVLANVYAIEFDLKVNEVSKKYGGLYRRYSDDFIVVLPKKIGFSKFNEITHNIREHASYNEIDLQETKTSMYEFSNFNINNLTHEKKSHIDYLGFLFDGKTVKIRGKSPYKFYRNASTLIKKAKRTQRKKGLKKIPYRKRLYQLYTDVGAERRPYGNFISYAKNAQRIFDEVSPNTDNLMLKQIKNRKRKLEKKAGIKIHIKI